MYEGPRWFPAFGWPLQRHYIFVLFGSPRLSRPLFGTYLGAAVFPIITYRTIPVVHIHSVAIATPVMFVTTVMPM